ncbi:hypothetical protein LSAT2_000207 [Lamellibrachia satsuma]|nr:hypothetical protein LSAT2_000207 [Lamellibrachia satsuma]
MMHVVSSHNPVRFLVIYITPEWKDSLPENYDMATRDGCRRASETVWSSIVFAVVVLVMMLVATTESASLIPACIKRCKERHNNCFDLCMKELITDPTKRKFCHGFLPLRHAFVHRRLP